MPGLKIQKGVTLTEICKPVVTGLDKFFISFNKLGIVTSGLRTAGEQLTIIQSYAIRNKLHKDFPEILTATVGDTIQYLGELVYVWQPCWSKLLNIGVIVNPPRDAKVLMSYIRDGIDKQGEIISISPHMRGTAFDIGGGSDGTTDELLVVHYASTQNIQGLKSYLVEPRNNAIHVDCEEIKKNG